jgi:L-aspartate oxidase
VKNNHDADIVRDDQRDLRASLGERSGPEYPPPVSLTALQQLHWERVGIVRDRAGLEEAAGILAGWQRSLPAVIDVPSQELANLVLTGRLLTEAAMLREESRGAHFRSDFPETKLEWQRHIVWQR